MKLPKAHHKSGGQWDLLHKDEGEETQLCRIQCLCAMGDSPHTRQSSDVFVYLCLQVQKHTAWRGVL